MMLGTVLNVNVIDLDQKMGVSVQMLLLIKLKKKNHVVLIVTLKNVPNVSSKKIIVSNVLKEVQKETHHQSVQLFLKELTLLILLIYQSVLPEFSNVTANV